MSPPDADIGANPPTGDGHFNSTHWSVVLLAGQSEAPKAEEALEQLCRSYWYPLYAYVRRKGHSPQDAQDLTQDFFVRLLEKKYLRLAAQERGRFRSFLLKSLNHFLVNDWTKNNAQKRGGGHKVVSLDEEGAERLYQMEPANGLEPENLYDKRWAMTLLERAMERLRGDYATAGKQELYDQLKSFLLAEGTGESYRQIAGLLGLSEGAVKVAVHRLRQRFRELVRGEVARTVETPSEVDAELRCLMTALNS